jgi:Flp pilus assembly protein TadG
MIKRLIEGLSWARRLEDERGSALIELAFCLPILIVLVMGLIDFSQMIYIKQAMSGISRQGSNLANRTYTGPTGSMPLSTIVSGLVTQGASLNIGTNGRIILSVVRDVSSSPQILDQYESPTGISVTSKVGTYVSGTTSNPATVPSQATPVLTTKQDETIYVTEVFYSYTPITPVGKFLKKSLASTFYEVAYF